MPESALPPPSHLPEARNPLLRARTTSTSTYCRICEACCGLIAELDGDRLVRVRPNSEHVHSRGFSCNKPQGLLELTYDPDRITTPMVRTGAPGEFTPVSWDEALDLCAARLSAVRDEHGPEAIAMLRGNPPFFDSGGVLWGTGILRGAGHHPHLHDQRRGRRIPADRQRGPLRRREPVPPPRPVAHGTGYDHRRQPPGGAQHQAERTADPRGLRRDRRPRRPRARRRPPAHRDRGPLRAHQHPPRHRSLVPHGCLQGDLRERCSAPRCPSARHRSRAVGNSPLSRPSFDLDDCADRCGIDRETLVQVARAFIAADSAIVYGGTGTCAQRFGTLTNILQDTILALTGNIDRVGGLLAGWAAIDLTPSTPGPRSGSRRSRVEGRPEVAGGLPSAGLAADITQPGRGPRQGAGHLRQQLGPDQRRWRQSVGGRPARAGLQHGHGPLHERDQPLRARPAARARPCSSASDYPVTTGTMQLRPTAYATRAVIDPVGQAKDSWWIFDEVSRRMGLGGSCPDKELEAAADARGTRPTPIELIDRLLVRGPVDGLTFDDLVTNHPNGVALRETLPVGRLTDGSAHSRTGASSCSRSSSSPRSRACVAMWNRTTNGRCA